MTVAAGNNATTIPNPKQGRAFMHGAVHEMDREDSIDLEYY